MLTHGSCIFFVKNEVHDHSWIAKSRSNTDRVTIFKFFAQFPMDLTVITTRLSLQRACYKSEFWYPHFCWHIPRLLWLSILVFSKIFTRTESVNAYYPPLERIVSKRYLFWHIFHPRQISDPCQVFRGQWKLTQLQRPHAVNPGAIAAWIRVGGRVTVPTNAAFMEHFRLRSG